MLEKAKIFVFEAGKVIMMISLILMGAEHLRTTIENGSCACKV